MKIEWGSLVCLEYDILLDSGELFDSSEHSGPLWMRVGDQDALPELGRKLIGLGEGDDRLICLTPAEALGHWDPNAVVILATPQLEGLQVEDGTPVRIVTGEGLSVCRAYHMTPDRVALDFNHPLAGKPIILFIRVGQVVPPGVRAAGPAR